MSKPAQKFWLTPRALAALGLLTGVLYFLLTEHRAHFITFLPYLILGLCPVMHFFMHRNHQSGHSHQAADKPEDR